jgi:hypothetical protein
VADQAPSAVAREPGAPSATPQVGAEDPLDAQLAQTRDPPAAV